MLTYNVFTTTQAPAFNITVQPELKNKEQSCSTELQACVAYSEHGTESNMAVMEVTIPSGYGVDEESLSKLLQEGENGNSKMQTSLTFPFRNVCYCRDQKI